MRADRRRWLRNAAAATLAGQMAWLLVWGGGSLASFVAAFSLQFAGLLAERWTFFAEANHPQNLYYQSIS